MVDFEDMEKLLKQGAASRSVLYNLSSGPQTGSVIIYIYIYIYYIYILLATLYDIYV